MSLPKSLQMLLQTGKHGPLPWFKVKANMLGFYHMTFNGSLIDNDNSLTASL